jgi:hypothetical protein
MSNRWTQARVGVRRVIALQRRVWIIETFGGPVVLAALPMVLAAIGTAWWLARQRGRPLGSHPQQSSADHPATDGGTEQLVNE